MEQTIQELEIVIRARVDEALASIKQVTDAIKGKVSQSTNEIKKVQQVSQSVAKQSSSAFSQMFGKKDNTNIQENAKQIEYLKSKVEELKYTISQADEGEYLKGVDILKAEAQIEAMEKRIAKLNSETKKQPSLWNKISSAIKKAKTNTNGIGNNITKSFNKGLKSIKKFTLSLLTVRSAFSVVSRASREYLSMDEELNNQITNSWRLLGTLLKPALETIINLFSKGVSYILSFIQALSGINFVANANAKALKNQAKAGASANKQLSGIDDINTLSSGSGSNTNIGVKLDDVDTGSIEKYVEKIKEAFKTGGWEEVGATIGSSISEAIGKIDVASIVEKGKSIGKNLSDGINGFFGENGIDMKVIGKQISDSVSGLLDIMIDFVSNVDWESVGKKVGDLLLSIDWIGIIGKLFIFLKLKIPTMMFNLIAGLGDSIIEAVKDPKFWDNIVEAGANIVKGIAEGIESLILSIGNVFSKIIDIFCELFGIHSPSTVFAEFGTFMIEGLINGINAMLDGVSKVFNSLWEMIKKGAIKGWEGIKSVFSTVGSFFSKTFSTAWNNVKNIFSKGGKIFDGIKDGIVSAFKTIVNGLISGINKVVKVPFDGINTALKTIKKVNIAGVKPFENVIKTISVPQIPKLATGNVATKPTIAMFGEYAGATNNPEITAPQKTMEASFRKVLAEQSNTNNTSQRIVVQVGANTLFDDMIDYANNKSQRNGVSVFTDI